MGVASETEVETEASPSEMKKRKKSEVESDSDSERKVSRQKNVAIAKKLKAKLVGFNCSKDAGTIKTFIKNFGLGIFTNGYSEERIMKLHYLEIYLGPQGLQWVDNWRRSLFGYVKNEYSSYPSFEETIDCLHYDHYPRNEQGEARDALRKFKQDEHESMVDYEIRFTSLVLMAGDVIEKDLVEFYLDGMEKSIRLKI